ncbi:MAG: cell division protein FtsZ [Alphaproteobacteria bacterium]|jgi:cell division protein FtsZ|nr:cell division protein FtsZ [Alphaproteobacteria bacterium]MBT5389995.1 cell division protein FtsZ [Alphaproteobacteria bacterium]MBT5654528.1 cell division protein FtsZ [Alphaproteobacteria bacterium]
MTTSTTTEPLDLTTSSNVENLKDLKPRISVIGVGGAGGNAVNNMIRLKLEGAEFSACNTDAQALGESLAEKKIQLGFEITQGLGAGSRPDVGRASAEEALETVKEHISGAHMLFITAGMGGGTGTGAAPVIAQAAREKGILTVGVVTKPFHFEGAQRMRLAEKGIDELQKHVDTLIIIPNQNLFRVANEKTTFADAFKMADDVLYSGVRGVTDLMIMPGLINLDFADVRSVMSEMGKAMMGTGEAEGDNRAIESAEAAISNPLLDDVSMKGARGVLINITGGHDMTLFEVDEAANRVRDEVDSNAQIIFGSTFDEKLSGKIRVSVVATGIESPESFTLPQNQGFVSNQTQTSVPDTISLFEGSIAANKTEGGNEDLADLSSPDEIDPLDLDHILENDEESQAQKGVIEGNNEQTVLFPQEEETPPAFAELTEEAPAKKETRRPGFFARLAGMARKSEASSHVQKGHDQSSGNKNQASSSKINQIDSPLDEIDTESLEIPAFLRRKNN